MRLIRSTYPPAFSVGLLILIFSISGLLSQQIFKVPFSDLTENKEVFVGMFLVGVAVVIMLLIIWEELLFPIRITEVNGGMLFRNHRTKLKTQLLIYCSIPAIFTFIYLEYEVNHFRFFIWAGICTIAPLIEKIASGINNYNDYLELTDLKIEYKNNEKEGSFRTDDVQNIMFVKDDRNVIHKMKVLFKNNDSVIIDLDEMELDAYYESIYKYTKVHYRHLLKETNVAI